MKHLTGLDATFFHLETPEMPMHVGSLSLLDLPSGYEGDFFERYKEEIGKRLHLAPVFERKLALMPFELSNPVWVDDDDVDLDYHVRRIVLATPGTFEQLERYVARLHSSLMDRSRPLWEIYLFEGLASRQAAIYTKVHHAAVDGAAGAALFKAMYDATPEPTEIRQPRRKRRDSGYQLGAAELVAAAVRNTFEQYAKLLTTLPNIAQALTGVSVPKGSLEDLSKSLAPAPKTPLNVSITNQRAYAARSVSLGDVKRAAKRLSVTLNDIVLAACAGALRRYLEEENQLPKAPLRAAVPVSLRQPDDTEASNKVSMILISLATDIADPLERLKTINQSSNSSKEVSNALKAVIPTDYPSFGAPWLMSGLAMLWGRSKMADTLPPVANVVISNVPGPQVPLYMAGAKVATYYPVSIPAHGMALNITVQSYNGSLDYGLIACRRALPDVDVIADYIVEGHQELVELADKVATPEVANASAKPAAEEGGGRPAASAEPAVAVTAEPAPVAVEASPAPSFPQAETGTEVVAPATPPAEPGAGEGSDRREEAAPVELAAKPAKGGRKRKTATA